MQMFKISFYKNFSLFLVCKKLKCVIFFFRIYRLEKSLNPKPIIMIFYLGYVTFFIRIIYITNVKKINNIHTC